MDGTRFIHVMTVILAFGSESSGIGLGNDFIPRRVKHQVHRRACLIDRKCPAIAGDIPVKLVMLLEEAEQAPGTIAVGIGVNPGWNESI